MRSLDRCSVCGVGRFFIYSTKTRGSLRTSYLRCSHCGERSKQLSRVDAIGRIVEYLSVSVTSAGKQVASPEQVSGYDFSMEGTKP